MKLSSLERRIIALAMALALVISFMSTTRRVEASGAKDAEPHVVNDIGVSEPLRGVDEGNGNNEYDPEWYLDYEYELADGKIILKNYIGDDTVIFVPKNAVIDEVTYQTELTTKTISWYKEAIWSHSRVDEIEEIVLEDGFVLPEDSSYVFSIKCEDRDGQYYNTIKKITMSNVDTSNVTNMFRMFYGDYALQELNLSGFDTSNVTDMREMFCECESLIELDLSGFDTSNVTDMSGMFCECESLIELDLSGFDTSNVTDMSGMFGGCKKLAELDISNLDTSKVTTMAGMFHECESLIELDVSSFDTGNVTAMYSMFQECKNLITLNLDNFDTGNVTHMGSMFYNCLKLETLNVSGFDTGNVTSMNYMFSRCQNLNALDVSGFDTSNVTNMGGMFEECRNLDSLDVSGFDTSNVTDMGSMFSYCQCLHNLDVSGFDTSNVTEMVCMFNDCLSLDYLDVSGFNTGCVTNISGMFMGCRSLNSLDVSNFDTSNVKYIAGIFEGCSKLNNIDVSGFDTSNVEDMERMFDGCESLSKIELNNFNTTNVEDIPFMFRNCHNLTEIDLSSFDLANLNDRHLSWYSWSEPLEYGGQPFLVFNGCRKVEVIKTPINLSVDIALPGTFADSEGNTYDILPKNLSSSIKLTRIKTYSDPVWTWNGTDSASARFTNSNDSNDYIDKTATISSSITKEATYEETGIETFIAAVVFNDVTYTNTKTKVIPKRKRTYGDFEYVYNSSDRVVITSYTGSEAVVEVPSVIDGKEVVSINGAFKNNTAITDVILPDSVTKIEYSAFQGATNLRNINLEHIKILGAAGNGVGNFAYCKNLSDIILPENIDVYGVQFTGAKMDSITIPCVMNSGWRTYLGNFETDELKFAEGIQKIALGFGGMKTPEIIIPDTVTDISESLLRGVKTERIVFGSGIKKISVYQLEGIDNIDILLGDNIEVLEAEAFRNSKISALTIPDSVTEIQYHTFYNCINLSDVTFSKNLTKIVGGYDGFMEGSLWYANQDDGVVYTGGALYAYKGTVPENTTINVKEGTKGIGYRALQTEDASGHNITSVILPDGLLYIGGVSFFNTGIEEISIPDTVTEIGPGAFANTNLDSVYIPSSVDTIGQYAFGYRNDDLLTNGAVWIFDDIIQKNYKQYRELKYYSDYDWISHYNMEFWNLADFFGMGDTVYRGETREAFQAEKVPNFTIIGYKGTAAEQYAIDNGFTFIDAEQSAHEHVYDEPTWTWTGYTKAVASFGCEECDHIETLDATVTNKVTKVATCENNGVRTYTATVTFKGFKFSTTKKKSIAAIGHSYGEPVWTWTGTSKAVAKFTCTNDNSHVKTVEATITNKVTTDPTCENTGIRTYTAKVTIGDKTYTTTKKKTVAAKGHSYGEPKWTWTGTSKAVAKFTCTNDSSHTESVTATISNKVTKVATCDTDGVRTYTAKVSFNGKTYTATKKKTIPAMGHSYGAPTWKWTGYTKAVATFTCDYDDSHIKKVNATITSKVTKKATTTTAGTKTYTATAVFDGCTYKKTKTEKIYAFDKTKTGLQKYSGNGGLYYVRNGVKDASITAFAKYENDWYYVINGMVNTKKTGIFKGKVNGVNATWYVKKGKVQLTFTGTVTINNKKYKVVKGKVQ